jgi:hypothetical protein
MKSFLTSPTARLGWATGASKSAREKGSYSGGEFGYLATNKNIFGFQDRVLVPLEILSQCTCKERTDHVIDCEIFVQFRLCCIVNQGDINKVKTTVYLIP